MGLLDSNKRIASLSFSSGTITDTFTTAKTLTTISNPRHQRYLMIDASISGFSMSEDWGCYLIGTSTSSNKQTIFHRIDGRVFVRVRENGKYTIDTGGFDVSLRFEGGDSSSKSVTINYAFSDAAPLDNNCKPIQLLYSNNVTLAAGTALYTLANKFADETMCLFKYIYFTIACVDSEGTTPVAQTFTVSVSWRSSYAGSTPKLTLTNEVGSVVQERGYTSEFLPVAIGDLTISVRVTDVVAGNKYFLNVYGVR